MTCAKTLVVAMLFTTDGGQYVGSNDCNEPQDDCPRDKSEGYAKCRYICHQPKHAEIDAMSRAISQGSPLKKGIMYVGHHRVCDDCQQAMTEAGIEWRVCDVKK